MRFQPLAGVGFDHSYTLLDEDRYFTPKGLELDGEPLAQPKLEDHYYSTTAIADKAIGFLKEHARDHAEKDIEIGRILDQVKVMGAEQDTVVVFLSDNGASSEQLIRGDGHDAAAPAGSAGSFLGLGPGWSTNSNTPLRLHKSWVNEGGISSPMIVKWPRGIKEKNALRHEPCHFVDLLPTMVDLAGGKVDAIPPLAGRSLAPAFARDGAAPHDFLYFNHNNNRAIRVGDWKLIATGATGPWELYDLSRDRSELQNLVAAQPERSAKLAALWEEKDSGFARVREAAPPTTKPRMHPAGTAR
jgi:arylsulfatase